MAERNRGPAEPTRRRPQMKAPASAPASSAYGKEVFVETFVESFKKVNMATIRARSAESVQLVKEKLKEIDWEEVRAQMKNFNVELVKPFKQVSDELGVQGQATPLHSDTIGGASAGQARRVHGVPKVNVHSGGTTGALLR